MAVTAEDIKERFDEFDPVPIDRVTNAITEAGRRVNTSQWGGHADDGILYLACHLLKFQELGDGLAAGAMTSKTVGPVSASFATPDVLSRSALGATAYGRYFLDLQSLVFPTRVL